MAVEELFQWGELFKFPVRPLQDGFIGIIQPVALTFGYGIQSLCIELAVVDGDICIDGAGDLNADETAAEEIRRPENVVSLLQVDPIELEFGYGIIPLADVNQGGDLLDRVVMMRR